MKMLLFALALGVTTPATAQGIVYDFGLSRDCVARAGGLTGQRNCIGAAANACMEATEGGGTTLGMVACLGAEADDWDVWLNDVYGRMKADYEAQAAEDRAAGFEPAPLAETLRDMQRAWIGYRDATCAFERAQWFGGTGAGPASLGCLMHETGEQVLYLRSMSDMR